MQSTRDLDPREFRLPRFERKWLYFGLGGLLALGFLFSSFYTIDADEVGVIHRNDGAGIAFPPAFRH